MRGIHAFGCVTKADHSMKTQHSVVYYIWGTREEEGRHTKRGGRDYRESGYEPTGATRVFFLFGTPKGRLKDRARARSTSCPIIGSPTGGLRNDKKLNIGVTFGVVVGLADRCDRRLERHVLTCFAFCRSENRTLNVRKTNDLQMADAK